MKNSRRDKLDLGPEVQNNLPKAIPAERSCGGASTPALTSVREQGCEGQGKLLWVFRGR